MRKTRNLLFVNLLIFVILLSGVSPALSQNETTPNQTTPAPNQTTVAPTATPVQTTVAATAAPAKFRVGPSVSLRPVTDVIQANSDGIVEFEMTNPSLNDVVLHVDARISAPAGFHVYGQNFGQAAAAGTVYGTFDVPPGTQRTIAVIVKADASANLGSNTLQFSGLYYPGDNKDAYQPLSLTYSVTVKEASKSPNSPEPSNPNAVPTGAATPTPKVVIPGFGAILAIAGILAIARLLSRKV